MYLTTASDVEALLGSGYSSAYDLMTTSMVAGDLDTLVYSQAFYNNDAENPLYAYVYQVDNVGDANNAFVEQFTVGRFVGDVIQIGCLTSEPEGFSDGSQDPEDSGSVAEMSNGMIVSFYYNNRFDKQIDTGEAGYAMYVLSTSAPGLAVGNVINSSVATGTVVGAVPEPGTIVMLIFAALTALAAVWFRSK